MQNALQPSARKTTRRRAVEMSAKYRAGMTLREIGDYYGITGERARQILTSQFGITRKDGGKSQRARAKQRAVSARKELSCLRKYGMSVAAFEAIPRDERRAAYRKFRQQRTNAGRREIDWHLTFAEWWAIWQESGKWEQRGRGKRGYVMARHGDAGAYDIGNVKIIAANENQSEYIRRYWKQVNNGERPLPKTQKHKYYGLQVGQTVVREVESKRAESERCHAYIIAKRLGWKFTTSVKGGAITVTRLQ